MHILLCDFKGGTLKDERNTEGHDQVLEKDSDHWTTLPQNSRLLDMRNHHAPKNSDRNRRSYTLRNTSHGQVAGMAPWKTMFL